MLGKIRLESLNWIACEENINMQRSLISVFYLKMSQSLKWINSFFIEGRTLENQGNDNW